MPIFACRKCGQPVTAGVAEVLLPPPVDDEARGSDGFPAPRMAHGRYAASKKLGGLILNPDGVAGTKLHPDPGRRNGCRRLDGLDDPNLICTGCGSGIATQQSDCWTEQQVTISPDAVRAVGQR